MLSLFAVILIHSSPLDEMAREVVLSVNSQDGKEQPFSLKEGETIEVTNFQFSGNKAIPSSQLQRLTSPFLNRSLSKTSLSALKQRITIFYKSKGYSQVEVSVGPKFKEGSLTLVIKEGKKS